MKGPKEELTFLSAQGKNIIIYFLGIVWTHEILPTLK